MNLLILTIALSLQWNTVTSDVDGQALSPGNTVTGYRVYGCQSNNCTPSTSVFISLVPADSPQQPTKSFNIDKLPKPQTYYVTAVNLSGESLPSKTVRVTPANSVDGVVVVPQ